MEPENLQKRIPSVKGINRVLKRNSESSPLEGLTRTQHDYHTLSMVKYHTEWNPAR